MQEAYASESDGRTKAEQTMAEVEEGGRRLADETARKLRDAKKRMASAYDKTAEGAEKMYRSARGYAQENPTAAAALTFGAGVCVGMMASQHNGMRAYRQGLVPVVAIALAHAVLDVFGEAR